jgi:hypothetical protein
LKVFAGLGVNTPKTNRNITRGGGWMVGWWPCGIMELLLLLYYYIIISINRRRSYYLNYFLMLLEGGSQSRPQGGSGGTFEPKIDLKFFRIINFASRFILLIKFKFKIYIFNNHYESRYKINGYKKF